jgi:hypothetical protein
MRKDAFMSFKQSFRFLSAVIGWMALGIQLFLLFQLATRNGSHPITAVTKFFDYFTIFSNILVAIVFTVVSLRSGNPFSDFFTHPKVKGAVAVYISITGLIYFLLLRNLWHPTGLQWLADILLHYLMPIAYLIEWCCFTPKGVLSWKDALRWLVFPLGFGVWALIWGAIFGFYPYPFIDVKTLTNPRVFTNIAGLTVLFFVLGLLYVGLDGWLEKRLIRNKQRASSIPSNKWGEP